MRIEKKINYTKKISIINYIQYFISLIISILFLIGFIPFTFDNLFYLIESLIVIQIIVSLIRFRILNVILELILLFLAVISVIPLLGYFFRFLGFIVTILDMSTFKSYKIYKKVEIKNFYPKKFKNLIKKKPKYKDANFKEK